MSGYVHVYTGNGKGKTTAALGLALRAAGAGWKVFFAQFAKGTRHQRTGRPGALPRSHHHPPIRPGRLYPPRPARGRPRAARLGLNECREAIASGRYRLVVLDEANLGPALRLFPVEELLELVDARPEGVELVLTGRGADRRLLDRADLVTEMQEIKHYYRQGVLARTGIEQ